MDSRLLKEFENNKAGFPVEVLHDLIENRTKYTEELLEILDYAVINAEELCKKEGFVIHILAMYTLAYYKEKRAYPGIIAIAKLPPRIINPFLEDTITEGLSRMIASVYDGNIEPIKEIIESCDCDIYARRAALESLVALVTNGLIHRDEIVSYFKELFNRKLHLLNEDVLECLIDMSFYIHSKGLEEEIRKANPEDFVNFGFDNMESNFEEQSSMSIECVLEETKKFPSYNVVFKEDVINLLKWLGKIDMYVEKAEENNSNVRRSSYDEDNLIHKNSITVQNFGKTGRNHPCPCGSGKKYKKCCGK